MIAAFWKFSCQIVIVIDWQLTGKHSFSFPSFVYFHLVPGKCFGCLVGGSRPFFEVQSYVWLLHFEKFLLDYHCHWPATHWNTFPLSSFLLYIFILYQSPFLRSKDMYDCCLLTLFFGWFLHEEHLELTQEVFCCHSSPICWQRWEKFLKLIVASKKTPQSKKVSFICIFHVVFAWYICQTILLLKLATSLHVFSQIDSFEPSKGFLKI